MKINFFTDDSPGLEPASRRRMLPWVAFAIDKILQRTVPFCSQPTEKLHAAVTYLEAREPRLAQCESS